MLILFLLFSLLYYLLSVQSSSASVLRYNNHENDKTKIILPTLSSSLSLSSNNRNFYQNNDDLIMKTFLNKQQKQNNEELYKKYYLSKKRSAINHFEPITKNEKQHTLQQNIDFLQSKYLNDNNNNNNRDCLSSSNCNLDNVRLKNILYILSKINDNDDPSITKLIYSIAKHIEYLKELKNSTTSLSRTSTEFAYLPSTTLSSTISGLLSSTVPASDTASFKLISDKYDRIGGDGDGGSWNDGNDYDHELNSDINLSNNMNLSGLHEGSLYIEEPSYIYARRQNKNNNKAEIGPDHIEEPPFIPPRGRKYSAAPALSDFLEPYELFIPNRGKKDDINEILKYDDLFFPNRGKRQIKRQKTSKLSRFIDHYDRNKIFS